MAGLGAGRLQLEAQLLGMVDSEGCLIRHRTPRVVAETLLRRVHVFLPVRVGVDALVTMARRGRDALQVKAPALLGERRHHVPGLLLAAEFASAANVPDGI